MISKVLILINQLFIFNVFPSLITLSNLLELDPLDWIPSSSKMKLSVEVKSNLQSTKYVLSLLDECVCQKKEIWRPHQPHSSIASTSAPGGMTNTNTQRGGVNFIYLFLYIYVIGMCVYVCVYSTHMECMHTHANGFL